MPEALANKKAIINVQKDDDRCLAWALKSALYPAKSNVSNKYSYIKCPDLNTDGINFPTPISQISKVKKQNNLAINVYGATVSAKLGKVNTFPYYISNQSSEKKRINLLMLTKDVEDTSCEGETDETYNPEQDYETDETYDPDASCESEIDETYDPDAEYPEQNKSMKETKYHHQDQESQQITLRSKQM